MSAVADVVVVRLEPSVGLPARSSKLLESTVAARCRSRSDVERRNFAMLLPRDRDKPGCGDDPRLLLADVARRMEFTLRTRWRAVSAKLSSNSCSSSWESEGKSVKSTGLPPELDEERGRLPRRP